MRFCTPVMFLLEPIEITDEGEYNFNVVSEVSVTDSFMSLDLNTRGCQVKESYHTCITRHLNTEYLEKCGCMPWKLGIGKEMLK